MAHEDLNRDQVIEGSSDRAFGGVFALVFLIVAAWPILHASPPRWWALALATVFSGVAWLRPSYLAPLNRRWIKLGVFIGQVVSPVALGVLFFGMLTPVAIVMRLAGKDPLLLKRDPNASSYWHVRKPPGPRPDSMNQQF
jgi:hypothetical protein